MKTNSASLRFLAVLVIFFLSIAYLLPVYVMVSTSLKSIEEINKTNYLLPTLKPQWINYVEVLNGSPRFRSQMLPRLFNSSLISFSVTALSLFLGGLGGYYLSRTRSLFARILFVLVGIALYLPYQVVIIPLSILMSRTGLGQSYAGLILSYLILNMPLASVLLGTFFLSIPRELEEAAEVDGASKVQTFFSIIVPISLPAYASVAII